MHLRGCTLGRTRPALAVMLLAAMGLQGCPDPQVEVYNTAPVPVITYPEDGQILPPGELTFLGLVSDKQDHDLTQIAVTWLVTSSSGDEPCQSTPSADGAVSCTLELPTGDYSVIMQATDSEGQTAQDEVTFLLQNALPQVSISAEDPSTVYEGDVVTLQGLVSDADTPVNELLVNWKDSASSRLTPIGPDELGRTSLKIEEAVVGDHRITLTASDPHLGKGEASITLQVLACADLDGDGVRACSREGYPQDCDDQNAQIFPGALEECDGIDNNCDGMVDEGYDFDQDGVPICELMGNPPDCNDEDPSVYPGAVELCDGVDNNCSGDATDEELDADLDGQTPCQGDCNDGRADINTDALEICDGIDNNCSASIDEGFDVDQDGFATCLGDCDDTNPDINPNAAEQCNRIDDNCNGTLDEGFDQDNDGFTSCGRSEGEIDCNDGSSTIYPGASEQCNLVDDSCDGVIDEGLDADLDGFTPCNGDCNDEIAAISPSAPETCNLADDNCDGAIDEGLDGDGDGVTSCSGDCNDADPEISPNLAEQCDGKDNDCDLQVDEGQDLDGDGVTPCGGDCDDARATTYPGAAELCDGLDNDCDGSQDEGFDQDGDGYLQCDTAQTTADCDDTNPTVNPAAAESCDGLDNDCDGRQDEEFDQDLDGVTTCQGDCLDTNPAVNPSAREVCNGLDDDCDGLVDDADSSITGQNNWYLDADGDSFGSASSPLRSCASTAPAGYASNNNDCNDADKAVNPSAQEVCDGKDNDCDGLTDDGDASVTGQTTWYKDGDGDGYGGSLTIKSCVSSPPSGYVGRGGDCDDAAAAINPSAVEVCDNKDNDCDGKTDDADSAVTGQSTYFKDADADGYGSSQSGSLTTCVSTPPTGYVSNSMDCNDGDKGINPGAQELCDGKDNDCDSLIDDADPSVSGQNTYNRDADGDTYGDPGATQRSCASSPPAGYVKNASDCNDQDKNINPAAQEVCDGRDNDCDGKTDDLDSSITGQNTFYKDGDGDGYGASSSGTVKTCATSAPAGYATTSTDCNDTVAAINPSAQEVCDTKDNDCDGKVDDADTSVSGQYTYYLDGDGDTFGNANNLVRTCSSAPPAGYVANSTDCNDADSAVNPAALEVCDGKDNDCDGKTDDADSPVSGQNTFYKDNDGDGYGNTTSGTRKSCSPTPPAGYVSLSTDCDDASAAINPAAVEVCDSKDNDCDGKVDDADSSITGQNSYYLDADGDTYGTSSGVLRTCASTAPSGYVSQAGDCNDSDTGVSPAAQEVCDGKDNDCDTRTDDADSSVTGQITYYRDADGDTWGNASGGTKVTCSPVTPPGYASTSTDCNDADPTLNPGAAEVCDGKDNDCDSKIDDADPSVAGQNIYYADGDADGAGNPSSTTRTCASTAPTGYVTTSTDCNDADATMKPGGTEVCDSKDNDCDGQTDEGVQTTYYRDADGDTYGSSSQTTKACTLPTGYVTNSQDCDDSRSSVHPGATEVCDSVDQDCDAIVDEGTTCYDDDGDGYTEAGGDCNDSDPLTYPGAPERFDGVDNNCDGLLETSINLSDAFSYVGTQPGALTGYALAGPGDVTGDGFGDMVVGSPKYNASKGAAHLVLGGSSWKDDVSLSTGGVLLYEDAADAQTGYSAAAAGDLNGDGLMDFAVGGPFFKSGNLLNAGIAYVVLGRSAGWTSAKLSEFATSSVKGIAENSYLGTSVGGNGDVNGDGLSDLLLGVPWPSGPGPAAGFVLYLPGKPTAWVPSISPNDLAHITGAPNDQVGYSVAITGRTSSDVYHDILVGGPDDSNVKGAAWFINGRKDLNPGTNYGPSELGGIRYRGETNNEFISWSVAGAGDVNGDGYEDFLVGRKADGDGVDAKAYLYFGPTLPAGDTVEKTGMVKFVGSSTDKCPCPVAGLGDVNGDGFADMAIGVSNNTEKTGGGKVYLFYGGPTSSFATSTALSSADMPFYGELAGDQAGFAVSGAGDVNGDGFDDFMIGAPRNDLGGTDAGKVYLLLGHD